MSTRTEMQPPPATGAPAVGRRRRGIRMSLVLSLTLFGLLLLMGVALSLSTDTFLTERNLTNLMRQGAMVAIIAVGQTFVIITAGIDLSVGAVVGVSTVAVSLMLVHGFGIPAAVGLTILLGVAVGAFHGFGIVQLGLPPFIMTLASLTALRGIGLLVTNGSTISGLPSDFTDFALSSFLGIPSLFWMVILVSVPAYVLLGHTRLGRYLYAIGSNPEAARLTGVDIKAMTYLAYIVSAGLASFVGVLLASRIGIGNATQGDGWELQAIASSVIGGTSLFGAVGTIQGPLLGSFILTTINNGANLLAINAFWQRIITGGLIIVIVYFDQLRRKRR